MAQGEGGARAGVAAVRVAVGRRCRHGQGPWASPCAPRPLPMRLPPLVLLLLQVVQVVVVVALRQLAGGGTPRPQRQHPGGRPHDAQAQGRGQGSTGGYRPGTR